MADFKTWEEFARAMNARADAMPGAFREGTTDATGILHAACKEHLNEDIYSNPEDTGGFSYTKSGRGTAAEAFKVKKSGKRAKSAKGRKKWRRTGALRRSERQKVVSDTEGIVYNDAAYALARHDLGLRSGDKRAIKGSNRDSSRIAPWRVDAIEDTEEARREAYREPILKALRG